jgi:NADH dehydrogenase [ubiquinone] 1 alpha subcomplex assembly factor 7
MTALRQELIKLIALEGPMSIARYMSLCLGHPQHGYYMTRDPLGSKGDFITAPEISQMFGELLGLWFAQIWINLGSPDAIRLVECGPGRGTLMQDALRAAATVPGFKSAITVDLIEMSPVLKAEQLRRLSGTGVPVNWHARIDSVKTDKPILLIGNEFLDALPIRQFQRNAERWHERLVGSDGESLSLGLSAAPEPVLSQIAPQGSILELSPAIQSFIAAAAEKLNAASGYAILIDYGHVKSGFGDTLQAMQRHGFVNPLASPGESDLTAHVDFDGLGRAAKANGLAVHGPVEQATFLRHLGLQVRAEMLMQKAGTQSQRDEIAGAERRLSDMSRTGMGSLFKVICLAARGQPEPPAFNGES